MKLKIFQNFKFFYQDIEHGDSTSRLMYSLRPFVLFTTAVGTFVCFEEIDQKKDQNRNVWYSRLYKNLKKRFYSFRLRIHDIVELEKK